ncbi:MAG: hypothetical protein Q7K44_04245 [Candidatus Liptonbacteria bacterium]|nr:hypothetical protein [Candidatus Liptonbacteria bacterium]
MKVLTNLLGVALMVFVAYWSVNLDARIGEVIDSTDGMRTFLFMFSLAGAAWFAKEAFVSFPRKISKKERRLCQMKI